jgi:hypothetical protein
MWMFQNQPGLVRHLQAQGKLEDHLDSKLQEALLLVSRLQNQGGVDREEAWQVAVESVLAPPDSPESSENPPQPIPEAEQAQLLRQLGR